MCLSILITFSLDTYRGNTKPTLHSPLSRQCYATTCAQFVISYTLPDDMRKQTDETLETTQIMHETLHMMLELMEALGFKPKDVHQDRGMEMDQAGTSALCDERVSNLYKGYHDMVEHKNRIERVLALLERQEAESLKQPDRRKTGNIRKAPRRKRNKWTRPKRH